MRLAALSIATAATLAAGAAQAENLRYFTYEPDSEAARYRTQDITFVVKPGLLNARVLKIYRKRGDDMDLHGAGQLSTGQLAQALPDEPELWNLKLYEVDDQQGAGFARGSCKGAQHAWLAFKALKPYQDLKMYVVTYDPASKSATLCETLAYRWRGEWKLPERKSDLGQEPGGPSDHR
ncbi:MAG: hypothetical protein JSR45_01790 [Proteobacteria bacterium]|nr:hypothetical protein [Pseudomonadota bacterium]